MPIPAKIAKMLIRSGLVGLHPGVRQLMGDGIRFLKYYGSRILEAPNEELKRTQTILESSPGLIDLSLGAPPMLEGLKKPESLTLSDDGYPPVGGLPKLKEKFAEKLSRENHLLVDPRREMLVCNGVSQGLTLFLDAFFDPGDSVVMFDPGYFMYRLAAEYRRLKIRRVPFRAEDGRCVFDENTLKKCLRGARGIVINSPNNPTGAVIFPEDLERIAQCCARYDVPIFSDEVYEHFNYVGEQASIASMAGAQDRTVTAHSFSKTYGLAAARVGVLSGNRWLLQPLNVAYLASAPFVPTITQRQALAALDTPMERIERRRTEYAKRRDIIANVLMSVGFAPVIPGGAFFFWIPVPERTATASGWTALLRDEHGVLIMPGESLAQNGRGYFRISFAGDPNLCETGIRRLASAFFGPMTAPHRSAA